MTYTSQGEMFRENFESNFTYIEGFMRNVRRYGNRPAIFCPASGQRLSYEELNRNINRLSNALKQNCALHKGDVVMYMLRNSIEFVYCYLAPQKIGAVNSPVNYNQSGGEIALNIDDSRPKVFVYDSEFKDTVSLALSMCKNRPETILRIGGEGIQDAPGKDFKEFMKGGPETEPQVEEKIGIYDESTRLYTSGTTSRPKGVPLFSINEVLSAHDVIMHFPLSPMDRTMNMTPWFHRGGIHSGGPCPTLYAGGEIIVMREFNAGLTLQYTEQYKITFLIGVPAVLSMLCRARENDKSDLSSLKGIITMGSPLNRDTCIMFQKTLTPNIFNGYGTTETFWNTFLRPSDLPEHAGSCGRACTDDDVRIVKIHEDRLSDPDELVAKDGAEIGEVILGVTAKSGMGYFENDELTERRFRNGFFYTGDLGTWDKDSYVTIVSRKDDMIVSSGENIYPSQVESILSEHPSVVEACVVGVPNQLREQVPAAYIVPADDKLSAKDLSKFVNAHPMLAAYKRPKFYKFVKELPHTATGKLQRFKVKLKALEDLKNGLLHR